MPAVSYKRESHAANFLEPKLQYLFSSMFVSNPKMHSTDINCDLFNVFQSPVMPTPPRTNLT